MFKTEVITFRTNQELRQFLDQAGRESQCSRSSLIERLLRDSLAVRRKEVFPEDARGAKKNHEWSVEKGEDGGDMQIITLGGVRIAVPENMPVKVSFDEREAALQIELPSGDKLKVATKSHKQFEA